MKLTNDEIAKLWQIHGGWYAGTMMISIEDLRSFVAAIEGTREVGEKDHVDTFIRYGTGEKDELEEKYARWVLDHFRQPASVLFATEQFMKHNKLFCTYCLKRYRVTGASCLGDVWLTEDFQQDSGYQKRVLITECHSWGSKA
jgi:hypothetical protein